MNKKIVVLVSSLALIGCATQASAFSAKSKKSPFQDNLTIKFAGFPSETILNQGYTSSNGINISGASFANADANELVKVYSQNAVEQGYPSMTMQYPTLYGSQTCTLTFVDGPWAMFNYKSGFAPVCPGIQVSAITQQTVNGYSITITDNEP